MKTIAIALLASVIAALSQQVGPSITTTATNVHTRQIVLTVTTIQTVQRVSAPVIWQGQTNWLTKDKVLSEHSVTNAAVDRARPGRPARP